MRFAFALAVLSFGAFAQDIAPPLAWKAAAKMETGRYDHCAVRLPDGRIFVIGGTGATGALASTEIYSPNDEFGPGPPLWSARTGHTCTVLSDGRIFVSGGAQGISGEIFDPVAFEWSKVGGGFAGRSGHTATLLSGDRVLLAGGRIGTDLSSSVEIYDPNSNTVVLSGALLVHPRARHSANALVDGRVLIAGGAAGDRAMPFTEVYDPETDAVSPGPEMTQARAGHFAMQLHDSRILLGGGTDGSMDLASAEVYQPEAGTFAALPAMLNQARQDALAIVLAGGQVLVAGGASGGSPIGDTELFETSTDQFRRVGSLTLPRKRIAGEQLQDGSIFGTGGLGPDGASAACGITLGGQPTLGFAQPLIALGTGLQPFDIVGGISEQIAGARIGLFGSHWGSASQNVTVTIAGPDGVVVSTSAVPVDANGSFFTVLPYTIQASDVGKRFTIAGTKGNTIVFGSQVQYDAKAPLSGTVGVAASSVNAVNIPISVTLSSSSPGLLTGTIAVRIGTVTQTFLPGRIAGATSAASFCCLNDPGPYQIVVTYTGDAKYRSVSNVFGIPHTVVARTVQLRNDFDAPLPLFTPISVPVRVIAPAAVAPTPGGSLSLTRIGVRNLKALSPLAGQPTPTSGASYSYKATFADKPSACFQMQYIGDGFYPGTTSTTCIPVGPAQVSLQITAANTHYTFGTGLPVSIRLTFPAEVGVVTRTVAIQPLDFSLNLNVGIGQASVSPSLVLPFHTTVIFATYPGGGDLDFGKAALPVTMEPVVTALSLQGFSAAVTNPFTLVASIKPILPSSVSLPVPITGTVQFFDGTLFVGQADLAADGTARLANVSRPVGARPIRAVYLGTPLFAGSASQTIQVTVR